MIDYDLLTLSVLHAVMKINTIKLYYKIIYSLPF